MPIEFNCNACGQQLRVPDGTAGRQAKCPSCDRLMPVPVSASDDIRLQPLPAASEANPYASPATAASAMPNSFDQAVRTDFARQQPSASRGKRLGGAILDGLFQLAVCIPGILIMFAVIADAENGGVEPDMEWMPLGVMGVGLLILWIIQMYLITTTGQTIGKRLIGTRIVTYDAGSNPGFVKAVIMRMWVPGLIGAVPNVGSCFSLINVLWIFGEERRCVHDLIAGTRVIDA